MNNRSRIILIVLGVVLAVNLVVFFSYRVRQQERIGELRAQRDQLETQLATAKAEKESTAAQIAAVNQLEIELDRIFNETWGEPDERLTPLLRELYAHAARSGLQPASRSYQNEPATRPGEATAMSISFVVEGTYEQLRRMISLLEASEQYVVIDSLRLSNAPEGGQLQISLQLRTLFREDPLLAQTAGATAGGQS